MSLGQRKGSHTGTFAPDSCPVKFTCGKWPYQPPPTVVHFLHTGLLQVFFKPTFMLLLLFLFFKKKIMSIVSID